MKVSIHFTLSTRSDQWKNIAQKRYKNDTERESTEEIVHLWPLHHIGGLVPPISDIFCWMLCRVLSLLCVGVSPGLVPVKVDVNQCVILFIILQQLLLTYQLKINKSFIHSFIYIHLSQIWSKIWFTVYIRTLTHIIFVWMHDFFQWYNYWEFFSLYKISNICGSNSNCTCSVTVFGGLFLVVSKILVWFFCGIKLMFLRWFFRFFRSVLSSFPNS